MEMPGMPDFSSMMPGARPSKVCLATGQHAQPFRSKEKAEDCVVSDMQQSANKVTFKMKCSGEPPMTGNGEINYTRDTFVTSGAGPRKIGNKEA